MSIEDLNLNKRVIQRLYEDGINRGEFRVIDTLVADDYIGANGERGPAGFANTAAQLRAGISGLKFQLEEFVVADDRVAVRWKWTGTHSGTLFGIPPSNRFVVNNGIVIYRLRDGKVVGASLQTDRLGVLQQVGVIPKELGRRPAP